MKNKWLLLLLILFATACQNKDLCDDGDCSPGNVSVKVVVNWENVQDARAMRMNIFSQTDGVTDYGRDAIPVSGEKYISLVENAAYRPLCYDYYASNIYFRDETTLNQFEAYVLEASRATYNNLATPVPGESTVTDAGGDFYVHSWLENFDVIFCDTSVLVINFYPENKIRTFTYRINNVKGASYVTEARGAISGMAATYYFHTDEMTTVRSTVLFENAKVGKTSTGVEYIEGSFTTFGPVHPYQNRFTIELLVGSSYYTAYWDVSGQIDETMTDREAKLARDGYDILIDNNRLPEIPDPGGSGGGDNSGGFEIGVGDWDNVEIYL